MGTYRKKLQGTAQYTSFIPAPLSAVHVEEELLAPFVSEAQEAIDQLNQAIGKLEEEEVQRILRKEAEASWMLAAGKYFFPFGIPSFSSHWNEEEQEEIQHLTEASLYALDSLETLPLCGRLLKNAHYLMCQSALYEKKYPREFRTSPVWIGPEGCNLKNALFVPPTEEDMTEAFSELEKFIHEESNLHLLIRASLIHYQFEAIHPFIDANGRTGRLLNLLFLFDHKVIQKPALIFSYTLGKYSTRYYTELQKVHESGAYESWVIFFLQTLKEAAQQTIRFLSTPPPSFA